MGKHRTTRSACLGEETVRTRAVEMLFAWHSSDLDGTLKCKKAGMTQLASSVKNPPSQELLPGFLQQ